MSPWKWASVLAGLFASAQLAAGAGWPPLPASRLLGMPVVAKDGQPLGRLQDLVLDVRNSRVTYAMVGFDGWGQTGEQLFPVPLKDLAREPGADRVVLQADPAALRDGAALSPRGEPRHHLPFKQYVRASRVIDRRVSDRTGTYAGEIADAVVDLDSSLVLHLLFDYDESWGPDQPPLRLSPQAFTFPLDGGAAVVNLERERLADPDAAP